MHGQQNINLGGMCKVKCISLRANITVNDFFKCLNIQVMMSVVCCEVPVFSTLFMSHFYVSFVFPCKQVGDRCVKYAIRTAVSSLLSIGYCSLRVGVSWP
jgi:hypothetical protein